MTKGRLETESTAKVDESKADAEAEERGAGDGEDEAAGEERRPSRRSPEKWGPEAASIT